MTGARTWSFDVTVSTHDDLHAGVIELALYGAGHRHHRVVVAAAGYPEALDTAYALAARPGREVTGLYLRI